MSTKDRSVTKGAIIGFKIETDRPEDSAGFIATELADSLQIEISARNDIKEYKEAANREREKAKQLSSVLVMLSEYKRKKKEALKNKEEWKVSRMEPMETYDENAIKKERIELIERAKQFDKLSLDFDQIAQEEKTKQILFQKKLRSIKR
jgi:hypothetical protein